MVGEDFLGCAHERSTLHRCRQRMCTWIRFHIYMYKGKYDSVESSGGFVNGDRGFRSQQTKRVRAFVHVSWKQSLSLQRNNNVSIWHAEEEQAGTTRPLLYHCFPRLALRGYLTIDNEDDGGAVAQPREVREQLGKWTRKKKFIYIYICRFVTNNNLHVQCEKKKMKCNVSVLQDLTE